MQSYHVGHHRKAKIWDNDKSVWEIEEAANGYVRFKSCSNVAALQGCYLYSSVVENGYKENDGRKSYFV